MMYGMGESLCLTFTKIKKGKKKVQNQVCKSTAKYTVIEFITMILSYRHTAQPLQQVNN